MTAFQKNSGVYQLGFGLFGHHVRSVTDAGKQNYASNNIEGCTLTR